ncbi:translation protein SH3-like domain-containing protein [Neurospora tetraspora]|uniref:Translation protein SH3-like domain-containing protein n=1 Tax=Neurospora tetraspora TaxID=94610 RepID=A0AAE0JAM6_9PEZI|nr:translation protein SH3-like domain-containing protein [Neurospora tetraspora]
MNVTAPLSRRPLGCLKAGLCQSLIRGYATAVAASTTQSTGALPDHNFFRITDKKTKQTRTAFAVFTRPKNPTTPPPSSVVTKSKAFKIANSKLPPLMTKPPSDPMPLLTQQQIARMDPTGARTALFSKARHAARVGDVLMVTHRRGGEPFAGVCLAIRRSGIDTAILLRNHLGKVGVEMWYKIYNKNVAGIEIIKRRAKRARRAKLMYMRQPKHDMGSVEQYVFAWKKMRKVLSSKGLTGGTGGGGGKQKGQESKKKN